MLRLLRFIGFGNAFVGGMMVLGAAIGIPFAFLLMPDWETWRKVVFGLMMGAFFGIAPMGGRLLGAD